MSKYNGSPRNLITVILAAIEYCVPVFELDIRMKAFKLSLCAIPFHNAKKIIDLLLGGGLPFHHINHALLA